MFRDVEFQRKDVDIADLLKSAVMVGRYRGEEIWDEVNKLMNEVPENALVLIDIRQAMPLQYTFCQYAFGPLFEAFQNGRWPRKYVIFQMHEFHKSGFFRGILKHLGTELPRKESEKGFVSAGFYAKLIIGDEALISFVGDLNENQERTLSVVNEMKEVAARQVVEKLDSPEEIVVDALRFLVDKHFVVGPDVQLVSTPHYYSFRKYL